MNQYKATVWMDVRDCCTASFSENTLLSLIYDSDSFNSVYETLCETLHTEKNISDDVNFTETEFLECANINYYDDFCRDDALMKNDSDLTSIALSIPFIVNIDKLAQVVKNRKESEQ